MSSKKQDRIVRDGTLVEGTMAGIQDGALQNVIQDGIKEDIEVALRHGRHRAGVMLIYAGMDAMAYLDMPATQTDLNERTCTA